MPLSRIISTWTLVSLGPQSQYPGGSKLSADDVEGEYGWGTKAGKQG